MNVWQIIYHISSLRHFKYLQLEPFTWTYHIRNPSFHKMRYYLKWNSYHVLSFRIRHDSLLCTYHLPCVAQQNWSWILKRSLIESFCKAEDQNYIIFLYSRRSKQHNEPIKQSLHGNLSLPLRTRIVYISTVRISQSKRAYVSQQGLFYSYHWNLDVILEGNKCHNSQGHPHLI